MSKAFFKGLFTAKMPYTVRIMIKTIIDKVNLHGEQDIKVAHAKLITDLLSACWLSNGFRWADSLGAFPALKEEALLQGHLLQATRLVVETSLACSELPDVEHPCFDITQLNNFISGKQAEVLKWYQSKFLDQADLPRVEIPKYEKRGI